jgi:hypothetical protein
MNQADFVRACREVVANYWRIRASIALAGEAHFLHVGSLHYRGVPSLGAVAGLLQSETVDDAMHALHEYASARLAADMLMAVISHFETRLSARLVAAGGKGTGTLGALQYEVQKVASVPPSSVEDLNEVRERRNAIVHHAGRAHSSYVDAAKAVATRTNGILSVPNVGEPVAPTGEYLTYAAHVLTDYASTL